MKFYLRSTKLAFTYSRIWTSVVLYIERTHLRVIPMCLLNWTTTYLPAEPRLQSIKSPLWSGQYQDYLIG
ncbi:hypothetical protein QC764_0100720 [Podospora pseudoanserina]|uniref:Uncharacterized protein n=1 Tax=Podospora pseudoanserina TaxID=2609844 RepID=A0ABR0HV20_9PEZI|nr:hypothetical protein QC764_0100720 [Podospora pseudoanserina]